MKAFFKLKNYHPKNIYYFFQGKYRMFIVKQYEKFYDNANIAHRILECKECLGNHPDCECPWAEILLTDKPCKCQTSH